MVNDAKELFVEIMDSLFSDKNRDKTIEYYKQTHYKEISDEWGIYVVKNNKNHEIELLEKPEIQTKKDIKQEQSFDVKIKVVNNKYLYIGKTNGKDGIKGRLSLYIRYGYGTTKNHHGGYLLWFLKNNKSLYVNYATLKDIKTIQPKFYDKAKDIFDNNVEEEKKTRKSQPITIAEIIEIGLISLHNIAYNYPPLANANKDAQYETMEKDTFSYGIYSVWKKYWETVLNK